MISIRLDIVLKKNSVAIAKVENKSFAAILIRVNVYEGINTYLNSFFVENAPFQMDVTSPFTLLAVVIGGYTYPVWRKFQTDPTTLKLWECVDIALNKKTLKNIWRLFYSGPNSAKTNVKDELLVKIFLDFFVLVSRVASFCHDKCLLLTWLLLMAHTCVNRFYWLALHIVPELANAWDVQCISIYVEGFDGLRGHQTNSTMTGVSDSTENDAWSSPVKTPPVYCRRGGLGTLHVKSLMTRGHFAAQ